jgi:hemerythrin superfamily protein
MPSRGKSPTLARSTNHPAASGPDAIALLEEDHRMVSGLFEDFQAASAADKPGIAERLCAELTVHATIEEQIFYPEARQCLDNDQGKELIDEAGVEHAGIKGLVEQIRTGGGHNDQIEAQVTVLKEYVEHHVGEEENKLFPRLRAAAFATREVGARLEERRKLLENKVQ